MDNMYGYVHVSTISQREDRQLATMEAFCVPGTCIFVDKQSGREFNRPAWNSIMENLSAGDTKWSLKA